MEVENVKHSSQMVEMPTQYSYLAWVNLLVSPVCETETM